MNRQVLILRLGLRMFPLLRDLKLFSGEVCKKDSRRARGITRRAITLSCSSYTLQQDARRTADQFVYIQGRLKKRDAAYAVEDVIESFIVDTIKLRRSTSTHDLRRSTSTHEQEISSSWSRFFNCCRGYNKEISSSEEINNFYEDVQKVIEVMDSIKKVVVEMMREKSSTTAVQAHQPQRSMSFTEKNSCLMVGFDDVLLQLLDKLTSGPLYRQVIPITGMGGIGKTTLARNIFQNALVKEYFHICAWVTISQKYSTKEIISEILDQVTGNKSEK